MSTCESCNTFLKIIHRQERDLDEAQRAIDDRTEQAFKYIQEIDTLRAQLKKAKKR